MLAVAHPVARARPASASNEDAVAANEATQVPTFCPLCVSRCGARATVDDGRLVALQPDSSHPTGAALCVKGKAAPEIVHHPERLLHPLRRTNPKASDDPGWERITWDEALDTVADRLRVLGADSGPESVVFSATSPSTSAMSDAMDWVMRLRRAFGSPNQCVYMELCGWGRYLASVYTYGAAVPGGYMPDLDLAGCILYWGYNPSVARLAHATSAVAALARGARLVVVDPGAPARAQRPGQRQLAAARIRVRGRAAGARSVPPPPPAGAGTADRAPAPGATISPARGPGAASPRGRSP